MRRLHLVPRPADFDHDTDTDECPYSPDLEWLDGVLVVKHREVL